MNFFFFLNRTCVQMNAFYFRPLWMASIIPPDMILTLLEGITAIIHYCLLDPTTQYHQVRLHEYLTPLKRPRSNKYPFVNLSKWYVSAPLRFKLLVNVDQKHLFEARSGILSILHMIMSSVTLLWSILHQADSSEKITVAASASVTTINLGATKVRQFTFPLWSSGVFSGTFLKSVFRIRE